MTWAEEQELGRLVRWRLRGWEQNPEYDDILAEANHAAWKAYLRAAHLPARRRLATAVKAAAIDGPAGWKRRWMGREGYHSPLRLMGTLSLEGLTPEGYDADETRLLPSIPSFEGEVLERLWRQWLWQRMETVCTPRMVEVLRHMLEGKTMQQTADALGLSRRGVEAQYYRALERCRERLR